MAADARPAAGGAQEADEQPQGGGLATADQSDQGQELAAADGDLDVLKDPALLRGLELNGADGVEVTFAPLLTAWETVTANAGSMPGFGAVRVEVEGMRDLPVRLWQGDDEGHVLKTGSAPVLGEYAVEFAPLAPGLFMVEPEGLGVWASVELTGLEAMWVSFRRRMEPIGVNTVRKLQAAPPDAAPAGQGGA